MANAGTGHAGCLDDDFDLWIGDERFGVVSDERRTLLMCSCQGRDGVGFVRPACGLQLTPCSIDVEIGNSDNVHALREARLREKHRSEFSDADYGDRNRSAGRLTLNKFRMEIQGTPRR